jgi:hypothetical protein
MHIKNKGSGINQREGSILNIKVWREGGAG